MAELGAELADAYAGREPLLVAPLKSSTVFLADLSRALPIPHGVDFLELAAYSGGRTGAVRLLKDLDTSVVGRHVLVVEDVVDTGLTLNFLARTLSLRSRLEIGLIVANRARCDYCRWVMERVAANEGMREEDIFFAGLGISRGRREAAIAKLALLMVAGMPLDPSAATNAPQARMFTQTELAEIIAQVALSVLTCTVLQSVAPQTVTARKEARS